MSKAKVTKKNTLVLPFALAVIILLVVIGVFVIINNNNKYVGAYNYNDRYTITLKQDGTCDFAEGGESFYSNSELSCSYEVKDETIFFDRDVIKYLFEYEGTISKGQGVGPDYTCAKYEGKYPTENCNEEIISIQETASVGDTGMIYKDKTYTKLK